MEHQHWDVTLSLEDDDRVNARKDLSQRVKTHAEVTRTSSTTEEEGWHVEIAVAVNSHPEGFERYIVGDLAGRESLHSSPQRNEQSQQGDLVSGYADDLAQVDCDCESRLLALDGLSCSAERVSTERARDGDGWFIKHETHERLWRSDRGFKCYHGSRRVPNQQEPFMDGGSDGDYVSHLAGHRLHRDLAAGRWVGPSNSRSPANGARGFSNWPKRCFKASACNSACRATRPSAWIAAPASTLSTCRSTTACGSSAASPRRAPAPRKSIAS